MKKRKINVVNRSLIWAMSAALVLGSFNSCTDYDDDIKSLQGQITDLANKLNGGKMIVSYKRNDAGNGYILTFQDGEKLEIKDGINGTNGVNGKDGINGLNGKDGAPGINGVKGEDGAPGKVGAPGLDGVTPEISIREFQAADGKKTNVWHIRYRKSDNTYDGNWRPILADENKAKDDVSNMFVAQGPKGDNGETGPTGPSGSNGTNGTNGSFAGTEQIKIVKEEGNAVYLPLEWDATGKVTKWSAKPAGYLAGSVIDISLSENQEFLAIVVDGKTYQVPMVASVMLYSLVSPAPTVTIGMDYGYIVAATTFNGSTFAKDNVLTFGSYVPVIVNPVGANIANNDFSFTFEDASGNSLGDVIKFDEITPGFQNMNPNDPGTISTRAITSSDINGRWSLRIVSENLNKANLTNIVSGRPYALKAVKKVDKTSNNTVLSSYAYKLALNQYSANAPIYYNGSLQTISITSNMSGAGESIVAVAGSGKALVRPSNARIYDSYITFKNKADETKYAAAISNYDAKNKRINGTTIAPRSDDAGDILTEATIDFVFNYIDMTGRTYESDPNNPTAKRYTGTSASTGAGVIFAVKFVKPLIDDVTIPSDLMVTSQIHDIYVSLDDMKAKFSSDKKTQWENRFNTGGYLSSTNHVAGLPTGVTFGGYYKTNTGTPVQATTASEVNFVKFTVDAATATIKRASAGGTKSPIVFTYNFAAGNLMNKVTVDLTLKLKDTPYEVITRTEKGGYVRNYGKTETVMIQSLYTEADPNSANYNVSLFRYYSFKWRYTDALGNIQTATNASASAKMEFKVPSAGTGTAANVSFIGTDPAKSFDRTHTIEVWYAPFGNSANSYKLPVDGEYKFNALSQLADGNTKLGTAPQVITVKNQFDNNGGEVMLTKDYIEGRDYIGAKYDIFGSDARIRKVSIDFADNATNEQKAFIVGSSTLFNACKIKPSDYAVNSMQTTSVTIPMKIIITDVFGITREWPYSIVMNRKN